MTESAPRSNRGALDRADLAFGLFLIVGLIGTFLLFGVGGLLAIGGFGGAAILWRRA